LLAKVSGFFPESRTGNACRPVPPNKPFIRVFALYLIEEQVLERTDVTLHADHFSHLHDFARTVAKSLSLNDDIDRRDDHFANTPGREIEATHEDHALKSADAFARAIRVKRTHRSVVACVHRLQQIEGFGSAHLAHDDAVGTHTPAVLDEVAHGDLTLAFEVWRPRLEPDHMRLLQLKLGRVLTGDDAFILVDAGGHAV